MRRSLLTLTCVVVGALALLAPVGGQQVDQKLPVTLRIRMPADDAKLLVDGKPTKQTGINRLFISPPLEPGQNYSYTLTAKWESNNYTTVTRTRKVSVLAGQKVEVDLRKAKAKSEDHFLIRFVPTPEEVVAAMCKLGEVGKDDVVYDLGCGDGRIVITAVKDFGAKRGVGVDIDPNLVKESRVQAKKAGVDDRVEFRDGDVLKIEDLSDATVVMLYMGEDVNKRLAPILKKSLKSGARIVSHDFSMGNWKADQKTEITDSLGDKHELYLWKIGK